MSFSVNLNQEVSPGSILVAIVGLSHSGASPQVNSITQTGATWTLVESSTPFFFKSEIWISRDAVGADLQINFDTVADVGENALVLEISGVFEVNGAVVDQTGSIHGILLETSTPHSGSTDVTSDPNELWLANVIVLGGESVSNPRNGYEIITQLSTGLDNNDINSVILYQKALTQRDAQATVASDTGPVFFCGSVATFFGTPPPYHISLTAISPTEIPENGGYLLSITGDFSGELGNLFKVFVGTNGDDSDPQCFSGTPGRPGTIYPVNETEIRCYTPRLDQGLSHVFVQKEDGSRFSLLANVLLVTPRSFQTNVFDGRKILPPHWRKGPLAIGEEF